GDPFSRVAVEALGSHGCITVTGEVTSSTSLSPDQVAEIAREVYRDCGYADLVGVAVHIVEQSREIAAAVDKDGAGDQGIMVGYACAETEEMLPQEVVWARELTRAMGARDGKAQVTIQSDPPVVPLGKGDTHVKVVTSVCGYDEGVQEALRSVVASIASAGSRDPAYKNIEWLENPNGIWTVGGFAADAGLTGRKIVVDNYGPNVPVGGGAFSGKDPTKVDRSGAYMARKIAVDYLNKSGASEVFCHLAYIIGIPEPAMAVVSLDGHQERVTGYDLRPSAIIEALNLRNPIYRKTAKVGHFGNGWAWEN
ncbi:methionine adenosyltransferase domain-containing protein, partial [Patescibacteria group bacterium]|nr:methionine adenosyltransferase domain-containing protein [Patescibacteria group bacterium]